MSDTKEPAAEATPAPAPALQYTYRIFGLAGQPLGDFTTPDDMARFVLVFKGMGQMVGPTLCVPWHAVGSIMALAPAGGPNVVSIR